MRRRVMQVHPRDNVLVALSDLKKSEEVAFQGGTLVLATEVEAKHKFTTTSLGVGDAVVMYGVTVGTAVTPIQKGERITTQNVKHHASAIEAKTERYTWIAPDVSRWRDR